MTDDDLKTRLRQAEAERDSNGRETDRLRKDWVEMRARAEKAEAALELMTADRDRWMAMLERMVTTEHMRFGVIQPDGTVEMLPCADWCYVCRLDSLKEAEAKLEMARMRLKKIRLFAERLPEEIRDGVLLLLGPEFDDVDLSRYLAVPRWEFDLMEAQSKRVLAVREYVETSDDDGIRTRENVLRILEGK